MLGFVAASSSRQLYAQEFRASITGQVADSSGAVIPGASITAVNVETRVASSTMSAQQGGYSLLYLLPGTYTVTVTAANFQAMVYKDVVLDTAQQLGLNVTLKPGSVAQAVEVTVGALELDTVSATTGGVIDQAKVENMPSTGLMVWDDVSFTQGIRSASNDVFNQTPRNNSNLYAVSGVQTNENAFYLNGAPVSDQGSWYFTPSQAAVQQMQASAMPYDAQYGRTGGGAFSTDLKAGTDAYHGEIYDYYGNKLLNANQWIDNLSGIPRSVNTRNTYGAESSGPIRKGKTFYFGSYEGFNQDSPAASIDTVPTAAEASGNFTGTGFTVYDPLSTTCVTMTSSGCTTYGRTPFPNDTIPSTDISQIGRAILAMYPAPNQPGLTNNYVTPNNNVPVYKYDQYIVRVDQGFSANTRMYALYTHEHNYSESQGNGIDNAAFTGATPTGWNYNAILDLTHIFSSSKVLDLKASYGHTTTLTITGDALQDNFQASSLGFNMPVVGNTSHQNVVPSMVITGATSLFGNTESGTADADADFSGSVTQLLGRHSLHYGAEFMDIQAAPTGVLGDPNGTFTFNSIYTQENPLTAKTGQGNEFADVLLGYPTSGSTTWDEPTFITVHYYGAFIQDNYRIFPKLSLNLGLRWDVNKSPRDRHNRINDGFCLTCTNPYTSGINYSTSPGLQNPLLGGFRFADVGGAPSEPYKVQWNDWQPRVGFSWSALPNTVVRGGYGIYFPWEPLAVDDTGFSQTTPYIPTQPGTTIPDIPNSALNSGTPYPAGAVAPSGAADGLETNAGQGISFSDTNRKLRMTQHWSFGVQRSMPGSILLDVEYLGTTVHAIPITTPLDVVSTAQQQACNATGATCNNSVANPFYGVLPTSTTLGASSTIQAWELMRAYPLFNGVSETYVPSGSSHYNALDVRVERRLKSLNFVFNYIYSNWIDRDNYLNFGNFRDANPTKELDSDDMRNYVDANLVYPLPSIRRNGVLGALANHWLFDSTVLWGTGNPIGLPSATFSCASYAPQGGQTRAHWFNNNESCWTPLATWQPRTTPLNIGFIRDPSYVVWNPAFHKQFALPRKGMFLQYRMEALNGANHPTWGGPSIANATPAAYSPKTSWTGFGTLSTSQTGTPRQIIVSLKLLF
jgi:hypothetical protein